MQHLIRESVRHVHFLDSFFTDFLNSQNLREMIDHKFVCFLFTIERTIVIEMSLDGRQRRRLPKIGMCFEESYLSVIARGCNLRWESSVQQRSDASVREVHFADNYCRCQMIKCVALYELWISSCEEECRGDFLDYESGRDEWEQPLWETLENSLADLSTNTIDLQKTTKDSGFHWNKKLLNKK